MCLEQVIQDEVRREGTAPYLPAKEATMPKRTKRLLMALAAVAAIYAARATGLDQGLVDEVFNSLAEVLVEQEAETEE